jgi:hypothetical protein
VKEPTLEEYVEAYCVEVTLEVNRQHVLYVLQEAWLSEGSLETSDMIG